MKWGLKGGISMDADSGPPRYVFWYYGGICHEDFTFIQIGSSYTVLYKKMWKIEVWFVIFNNFVKICKYLHDIVREIYHVTIVLKNDVKICR